MDNDSTFFWLVVLLNGAMILQSLRQRAAGRAWLFQSLAVAAINGSLWSAKIQDAGTWMFVVTFVLLGLPTLLMRLAHARMLRSQFRQAAVFARMASWLHPFDGWLSTPAVCEALHQLHLGDPERGMAMLRAAETLQTPIGRWAHSTLLRMDARFAELREWIETLPIATRHAEFDLMLQHVRAAGELHELALMVRAFSSYRARLKLLPAFYAHARLSLFAFSGRVDCVGLLLQGPLQSLPKDVQNYWIATAQAASGQLDRARALLEETDKIITNVLTRRVFARRLSELESLVAALDTSSLQMVELEAEQLQGEAPHVAAESMGRPWAVYTLTALNLVMFLIETQLGGSTNLSTLDEMGALRSDVMRTHEYWRMLTALFLHYGAMHIAFNLLALNSLGPFVEHSLGRVRMTLVYLLGGLGSMLFVALFPTENQLLVGASGGVMTLVGAQLVLWFRAWRDKVATAKERVVRIVFMIAIQTVFDISTPQVSLAGHLSGLVLGVVLTSLVFWVSKPARSTA